MLKCLGACLVAGLAMGVQGEAVRKLSKAMPLLAPLLALASAAPAPAPCACMFEEAGEIPAELAKSAGSKTYGVDCKQKHDSVPGTEYYKDDTECPDKCVEGCNFLVLEWCYVKRGCIGATHYNTSFDSVGPSADLAYSYEVCGNPSCWHPSHWDEGCPGGEECKSAESETTASGSVSAQSSRTFFFVILLVASAGLGQ